MTAERGGKIKTTVFSQVEGIFRFRKSSDILQSYRRNKKKLYTAQFTSATTANILQFARAKLDINLRSKHSRQNADVTMHHMQQNDTVEVSRLQINLLLFHGMSTARLPPPQASLQQIHPFLTRPSTTDSPRSRSREGEFSACHRAPC